MDAHILAIIDENLGNWGTNPIKNIEELRKMDAGLSVRILDMTPGAKVSIYDYPMYKVRLALGTGKLTLPGVRLINLKCWAKYFNNPKDWRPLKVDELTEPNRYLLNYYGKPIDSVIPLLGFKGDIVDKYILLKIGYEGNRLIFTLSDIIGGIYKVDSDDILQKYSRRLVNVKLLREAVTGRENNKLYGPISSGVSGIRMAISGTNYRLVKLDGTGFKIEGEPLSQETIQKKNIENQAINSKSKFSGIEKANSSIPSHEIAHPNVIKQDPLFSKWNTIEEFKRLLESRGLGYNILELDNILQKIDLGSYEVLNIPVGVKIIGELVVGSINNIKEVRIPNTVEILNTRCFENLDKLNRITYQDVDYDKSLNLSGLSYHFKTYGGLGNDPLDYLPISVHIVSNLFNYNKSMDKLVKAKLSSLTKLELLWDSFNNIGVGGEVSLPEQLTSLVNSFKNCNTIESLEPPNSIEVIRSSFIGGYKDSYAEGEERISNESNPNLGIKKLIIKDGSKLAEISESFNNCSFEVLDLSEATQLQNIYKCFNYCKHLRRVILPAGETKLNIDQSFNNCDKLTEVVVGHNGNINELKDPIYFIANSFNGVTIPRIKLNYDNKSTIIYSFIDIDGVDVGSEYIMVGFYRAERLVEKPIKILPSVRGIGLGAFELGNLDLVDFSESNLDFIGSKSFERSNGKILDLFHCINVDEVSSSCFQECLIGTVILPRNTRVLGDYCFKYCIINKLLLPETLEEIGRGALSSMSLDNGPIALYTVKKANVLKHIQKSGFIVYEFDTIEEAYEAILGKESEASNHEKLKAKLAFSAISNETVKEMSEEPYLNNITLLMKYYKKFSNPSFDPLSIRVGLNKSKFSGLYLLAKVKGLINTILDARCDIFSEPYSDGINEGLLTNPFIILSNLITKMTKPSPYLSKLNNLDAFLSSIDMNVTEKKHPDKNIFERVVYNILYSDKNSSISYLELWGYSGYAEENHIAITFISIGGKVVYVTTEYVHSNNGKTILTSCAKLNSGKENNYINYDKDEHTPKCNITDLFNNGNRVCWKNKDSRASVDIKFQIDGVSTPPKFASQILEESSKQLMCIYSDKKEVMQIRYLMSLIDGKIIKVKSATSTDDLSLKSCGSCIIVDQYRSIDDAPKEVIKAIRENTFNKDANNVIMQLCERDNLRKYFLNQPSAYDKLETSLEFEVCRKLRALGIEKVEDLNHQLSTVILNTVFFKPADKKVSELVTNLQRERMWLSDGTTLICKRNMSKRMTKAQMIGYNQNFIIYLIKPGEELSGNVRCYVSNNTFSEILSELVSIEDSKASNVGYVDNTVYNIHDFYIMDKGKNHNMCNVAIGISRKTGYCYMLAISDEEAHILFRFKDSESMLIFAYEYHLVENYNMTNKMNYSGKYHISTHQVYDIKDIAVYLTKAKLKTEPNIVQLMRDMIINGEPNGIECSCDTKGLLSLLARQPKQL